MTARGVPGLSLAVVADGEPVTAHGFGETAVEEGHPVTGDTLFRLASVTKVVTTIGLLRLVERKYLELDRPIRDYLPGLRLRREENAERVTLRMLLSHTSGLSEGAIERPWRTERRAPGGLAAFVEQDLPRCPVVGGPGELYFYSNLGFNLAGRAAEVATGVPFGRLFADHVVEPLGLTRTFLDPTVAMTYPVAQRHRADGSRIVVRHDGGDDTGFHPSGYVFSTASDMARVVRMLLGRGQLDGRQVLQDSTVDVMWSPHADVQLCRGLHYGLASVIEPDYKGIRRIGHEGVLRGYCAKMTLAPDHGIGVVVLYNHEYNEEPRFFSVRDRIIDRVFDDLLGLPPGAVRPDTTPVTAGTAERLAGRYAKVLGAVIAELETGDAGGLSLRYEDRTVPLRAAGPRLFAGPPTDEELRDLPWPRTPYVIDDHVSLGVPEITKGPPAHITINGQPYRRIS